MRRRLPGALVTLALLATSACAGGSHDDAADEDRGALTSADASGPSASSGTPSSPTPSASGSPAASSSGGHRRSDGRGAHHRGGHGRAAEPACTNAQRVHHWPLRRIAAQTFVVPVPETQVGRVAAQVRAGVGGVILFGSRAPRDLRADLHRLTRQAPGGVRPLVMTDEEGGAVQRMANVVGEIPSARTMGRTMTPAGIERLARTAGQKMRRAGVTMDLAPVLDLDDGRGPSSSNAIGTRSFSIHPAKARRDGLAFAHGLEKAGVLPVVKHFPGLGRASGNTDVEPAHTQPWKRLRRAGLRPFEAAVRAGVPAVMMSTARVPGLTRGPAALSPAAVRGVLRHRLGYDGLVLADSLSGGAVRQAGYPIPAATVRALAAGVDMVMFSAPPAAVPDITRRTLTGVVNAVRHHRLSRGRLESAAVRALTAKGTDLCG